MLTACVEPGLPAGVNRVMTEIGYRKLARLWRTGHPKNPTGAMEAWKPILLEGGRSDDMEILLELNDEGRIRDVHDRIWDQLIDLVKVRAKGRAVSVGEADAAAQAILNGTPMEEYGVWAFYPWSGRLVHVLPEAEFQEVRLDRNQNKVTREEQARLAARTVGIVGLSVGNAAARTAALEGVCGTLKLADFDCLDLSNLNRIQAGVQEIGCNKAVIAARQIFETNPYARVVVFTEGVTEANMEEFLAGEPRLDVLVDECDDLTMKMRLRRRARELGLPVLMETSDRGMLDVERFDLEPGRAIFHGLVARYEDRNFKGLTNSEKVPVVLSILGAETLSPRMGASLVEVGETISTWPQLASDVALGGASICAALRGLGLGQPLSSGRYHVDMQAVLGTASGASLPGAEEPAPAEAPPPAKFTGGEELSDLQRFLVEHAALAPSGGNVQPWRFHVDGDSIWVVLAPDRAANLLDVDYRASYLALGAAVENMSLAAASRGWVAGVEWLPLGEGKTTVARVRLRPGLEEQEAEEQEAQVGDLFAAVSLRVTDRRLGPRLPMTDGEVEALESVVRGTHAALHLLEADADLEEAGAILGRGDRVRFLCGPLHREAMGEIRWTDEEARTRRDGLDLASLELAEKDQAALRLLARPEVVSLLREQGGGEALEDLSQKWGRGASGIGLMTLAGDRPQQILEGGRIFQRIWLKATRLGLGCHPMTAVLYMLEIERRRRITLYQDRERRWLEDLDGRLSRLFRVESGQTRVMLFRLHRASGAAKRSLRLPIESVVAFGPPARESLS